MLFSCCGFPLFFQLGFFDFPVDTRQRRVPKRHPEIPTCATSGCGNASSSCLELPTREKGLGNVGDLRGDHLQYVAG